jgi:cobalt/nickel transport system permease protein
MHIPDGYLGPVTSGALFAMMLPVWAVALKRVKKTLQAKQVPLLAVASAFSFVVMMIDIPIPGGTSGHAVGAVLAAILLGPWAACIAITVTLVIQALLFGDGGITAIGANSFNMAFLMSFSGYFIYRLISGNALASSWRRIVAASIAGYLALNLCAFTTALMFGWQPLLHRTPEGQTLYSPYALKFAIPSMVGGHLLVFGWIEAALTALVLKYLQKQDPKLLMAYEKRS